MKTDEALVPRTQGAYINDDAAGDELPENVRYSLCSTTVSPIKPSMTVLSHGYSLSRIVT